MLRLQLQPATNKAALEQFMHDYEQGTVQHPTSPHLRVWDNKTVFEVSIFGGAVRLSYIGTISHGKGHGTSALRWLLDLADTHGVEIKGTIQRVGREGLSERDLKFWYRRHGFQIQQKSIVYPGKQPA